MFNEPMRVIDLGVFLDEAAYPPWGYRANHVDHAKGAQAMAKFFNLREVNEKKEVGKDDFPESLGMAWTSVHLSDHTGNHIDAPFHFGPECEGKPAKKIDQVPLDWCMGPGIRLDFRGNARKDISAKMVEEELARIGAELKPGMIPLLWTGADEKIDIDDEYFEDQAGLSEEALHYILDHGIKLIAIDAYAMDVSYETMSQDFETGEPRFFPLHFVGREREHMHLEKLTNLEALPKPTGFYFMAFPIKLRDGSAGWVRPVAMVPESDFAEAEAEAAE